MSPRRSLLQGRSSPSVVPSNSQSSSSDQGQYERHTAPSPPHAKDHRSTSSAVAYSRSIASFSNLVLSAASISIARVANLKAQFFRFGRQPAYAPKRFIVSACSRLVLRAARFHDEELTHWQASPRLEIAISLRWF